MNFCSPVPGTVTVLVGLVCPEVELRTGSLTVIVVCPFGQKAVEERSHRRMAWHRISVCIATQHPTVETNTYFVSPSIQHSLTRCQEQLLSRLFGQGLDTK